MTDSTKRSGNRVSVKSLAELPQTIPLTRDLWPDIQSRLSEQRHRKTSADGRRRHVFDMRWPWTQVATLVAMVVLLGIGFWIGHGWRSFDNRTQEGRISGISTVLRAEGLLDPRYVRVRAELLRSVPKELAALPPKSREKVLVSLTAIHKAMRDIEEALGRDSGNALLQELLIDTCQDEMRVLTTVHEASSSGKEI